MNPIEKEKLNRIRQFLNGREAGPVRVSWHPTNRYNLDCLFCGRRSLDSDIRNEMDDRRINNLIEESKQLGVTEWTIFGGGEPLSKMNLIEHMEKIKRPDMQGTLITNGTLFSPHLVNRIVEMGWDFIEFSIDSPLEATYEYLRNKKGAYKSAVNTLNLFKNIKAKKDSLKPHIIIRSVINNENCDQTDDLIDFASEFNCLALELNEMVINKGTFCEKLTLTKKERTALAKKIERARKKARDKNINLLVNLDLNNRKIGERNFERKNKLLSSCFVPFTEIMIRPDGSVSYCCSDDRIFGSLKESTLEELWFGNHLDEKRRGLMEFRLDDACKKCKNYLDTNQINLNKELLKSIRLKEKQE